MASVLIGISLVSACGDGPERDASPREFPAYSRSRGPGANVSGIRVYPDLPELEADRRVSAVLEIDRAEEIPELSLAAPTRNGPVDLKRILGEVGIELEVVWSEVLPGSELIDDPWPGLERLQALAADHRMPPTPDGEWRFYLLLGRRTVADQELSMVIDSEYRSAAVVFIDPDDAAGTLHAVGHEIGHMLNLPHPWEVAGDTRSLMSYPWRWEDWNWLDPSVFRFDDAARRHILRSPESAVRPDAGPWMSSGPTGSAGRAPHSAP